MFLCAISVSVILYTQISVLMLVCVSSKRAVNCELYDRVSIASAFVSELLLLSFTLFFFFFETNCLSFFIRIAVCTLDRSLSLTLIHSFILLVEIYLWNRVHGLIVCVHECICDREMAMYVRTILLIRFFFSSSLLSLPGCCCCWCSIQQVRMIIAKF